MLMLVFFVLGALIVLVIYSANFFSVLLFGKFLVDDFPENGESLLMHFLFFLLDIFLQSMQFQLLLAFLLFLPFGRLFPSLQNVRNSLFVVRSIG